jgi:hypothetical protein
MAVSPSSSSQSPSHEEERREDSLPNLLLVASSLPARNHHHPLTRRSSPIAIVRPRNDAADPDTSDDEDTSDDAADPDTSDDEEDYKHTNDNTGTGTARSFVADVEGDAVRIGLASRRHNHPASHHMAHSLPTRLLCAPRLGSVTQDYARYRQIPSTALPPAMTLHEASASGLSGVLLPSSHNNNDTNHSVLRTTTSYGSLRESNQRGTFLDGPSSYRDSRTGDIRSLQRVRFQPPAAADDASEGLSIRDRIQQARDRQHPPESASSTTSAPPKPTSSLAAMFDDDDAAPRGNVASSLPTSHFLSHDTHSLTTFYNTDGASARPSGALSTSLTGLEILQRGGLARGSLATIQDEEEVLPRTLLLGHNALLSRSLSDPRGAVQTNPSLLSTARMPPLQLGENGHLAAAPPTSFLAAALQQQQQQQPPPFSQAATNLFSSEVADLRLADPDTEGAFEMDME